MAKGLTHEPDTDINKITQANRQYEPWPSMVHKFTPGKESGTGTFAHKRVENEKEQSNYLKAGWFKTPLEAESAATDGNPHQTDNDALSDDLPEPDDATSGDPGEEDKPKRRR
jgi:hypothetical protein